MTVNRPIRRTCRQFLDGEYAEGGRWSYVLHPKYAESPTQYIRGFLLLLKDLQELFDYVEPSDTNLSCYSYRIHSLLLRACVEAEANCKAILKENGYAKVDKKGNALDFNMSDYKKLDITHRLSSYQVRVPVWNGIGSVRMPFAAWSSGASLPWYDAYNATKHDRHVEFQNATFEHLVDACCGVFAILSAQFWTEDFSPAGSALAVHGGPDDGMEPGIGGYFRVKFPQDFPDDLRYEFDWHAIKTEADPFITYNY